MSQMILSRIASLYVILPALFILFAVSQILRHRQSRLNGFSIADRIILTGLLIGYLALYTHLTLTYRRPSKKPQINLELFWSYRSAFQISDGIPGIRRLGLARQILLNILVMIPAGLLLPLVYNHFRHPYILTVLTGFSLSVLTEVLQYFTRLGLCELDDVLNNTLGCLAGILLFHFGTRAVKWICRQRTIQEIP